VNMNLLGTTLIIGSLVLLADKVYSLYKDAQDPPRTFDAKVAKIRLDTKKPDGVETYTYIITFYLYEENKYKSFSVPQKIFDEILEKDNGILKCHLKRQKFLEWKMRP
jgi:hypothetical protein